MSDPKSRPTYGSKFDLDLLDGQSSEDALAHTICWCRFEVKADHRAEQSGNHAVEVGRLRHGSTVDPKTLKGLTRNGMTRLRESGDLEPSGITVTEAQWWAIEYRRNQRRWLIVHVEEMKRLAGRAVTQRRVTCGGDDDRSLLALVPLKWLVEVGKS